MLLANKTDLDQRRVVSPKEGKELAMSKGLEYFECSAVSPFSQGGSFHRFHCVDSVNSCNFFLT